MPLDGPMTFTNQKTRVKHTWVSSAPVSLYRYAVEHLAKMLSLIPSSLITVEFPAPPTHQAGWLWGRNSRAHSPPAHIPTSHLASALWMPL